MSIRAKYEKELNEVFVKLIDMCHMAEIAIEKSITALKTRNDDLAKIIPIGTPSWAIEFAS